MSDLLQALLDAGQKPVLHQFWRSSATWRVRWALLIKQVPFEIHSVNLLANEQNLPAHRARSPVGTVPALQLGERFLTESVAILEWLERVRPAPALYPADPWTAARVRQLVEVVNSEIHPLQSGAVRKRVSPDEAAQAAWTKEFNQRGVEALAEAVRMIDLELGEGRFLVGDSLTAADLFVVPQLDFARRFGVDTARFARLTAAESAALATEHAAASRPERQPGAPA